MLGNMFARKTENKYKMSTKLMFKLVEKTQ